MSCYHPLVGLWNGDRTDNGKKQFKIDGHLDPVIALQLYPGSVVIPCGHCIGCKLDYSRAWADRMMLELEVAKKAIFLTLTYNNDNATWCKFDDDGNPVLATLVKRDVQLFMKRLRKEFSDRTIRFYLAGEYGSRTLRPHYHLILFGIGLDDFPDKKNIGFNELQQAHFTSDRLAGIWSNGFILLSDVSWRTCAYVARYVTKKALKSDVGYISEITNQLPEFSLMSRRPGIGAPYLESHPELFDYANIPIAEGQKVNIPKYFVKKLELSDPDKFANIKLERSIYAKDRMMAKLSNTDLSYLDYLEVEENQKLSKMSSLRRYV